MFKNVDEGDVHYLATIDTHKYVLYTDLLKKKSKFTSHSHESSWLGIPGWLRQFFFRGLFRDPG